MELFFEGMLHAVGAVLGIGIAMGMMPPPAGSEGAVVHEEPVEEETATPQDLFAEPVPAAKKRVGLRKKKAVAKAPRRPRARKKESPPAE